jgi:hypothetical protein
MSSNETALEHSQAPEHSPTPALAIVSPTGEPALDEIVVQTHSFIFEDEEEPIEVDVCYLLPLISYVNTFYGGSSSETGYSISPNLETDSAFGGGDVESVRTPHEPKKAV